jgi:hypothetical protein
VHDRIQVFLKGIMDKQIKKSKVTTAADEEIKE